MFEREINALECNRLCLQGKYFYCFGVRYAMFTREVIVLECGTLFLSK